MRYPLETVLTVLFVYRSCPYSTRGIFAPVRDRYHTLRSIKIDGEFNSYRLSQLTNLKC